MSRRAPRAATALLVVAALAGCGKAASTSNSIAPPPSKAAVAFADTASPRYVGMNASEVLPEPAAEQEAALQAMAASGVGLFRQTFRWDEIEPKRGQFTFAAHDRLVASAAKAGITVLPVVFALRPGEAAKPKKGVTIKPSTTMNPKDPEAFAQFAALLAKRYGPGGSFWKAHPTLPPHPITAWQIWNEPNIKPYWGGRPNPPEYTEVLRASAKAIRAVDPKAEIVTGGIPKSKQGIPLKTYVEEMAAARAKGTFDTLAIHPYATSVDGVISGIETARKALDRAGMENVGIRITEVGWATSGPHSAFSVSTARQAQFTAELLTRTASVAADLKLRGVAYYGWRDVPPYRPGGDFWGLHTGLMTKANTPKPSLATFAAAAHNLQGARLAVRHTSPEFLGFEHSLWHDRVMDSVPARPAAPGRPSVLSPGFRSNHAMRAAVLVVSVVAFGSAASIASASTVVGTPGPDHLVAPSVGGDTLYGGGGSDTLVGGPGPDVLYGVRSGNKIDGAAGDNYIEGGTGDDTIVATDGNNTVISGPGDDSVTLGNGNNWVDAGGGSDTVTVGNGNNVISGGSGVAHIVAGSGNNTVYYRSGPDTIKLGGGVNTIYLGVVGQFADIDCGGNPASALYVNAQQDPGAANVLSAVNEGKVHGCATITTFNGPSVPQLVAAPSKTAPFNLVGTDGADKLFGGHGGGFIDGKDGNNILWADREHDTGGAFAQSKTTTIQAGDGDNEIYGGRGTNKITVGNGNNFIRGGAFNNAITTGSGDNVVRLQGKGFNTVTFNGGSSYIEAFTRGPRATVNCNANGKAIVIYGVRKPKTNCTTVVNAKTKLGQKLQVQGTQHIALSDPIVSFPIAPGQDGHGVPRPAISAAAV